MTWLHMHRIGHYPADFSWRLGVAKSYPGGYQVADRATKTKTKTKESPRLRLQIIKHLQRITQGVFLGHVINGYLTREPIA